MSELMGWSGDGEEYPWTWGISEDQLRLFDQHLHTHYEPGMTLEDLSEVELEAIEHAYYAQRFEIDEEVDILPPAQQARTGSVEELEALFALPDIDEPEIASEN
jgi:hypothetical protein